MVTKRAIVKRRAHTRYKPFEAECFVMIDPDPSHGKENFTHTLSGLAFSEAHGGCAVVMRAGTELQTRDIVLVKVGPLSIMKSEVVWRTEVDADIVKVGIKFLE